MGTWTQPPTHCHQLLYHNACVNTPPQQCPIIPVAAHKCPHLLLQGLDSLVCLLFCLLA